jgi:23S rRNA (cytidine1920-2'-O)/16S rRNA (cytidine1409-2'-O)-methyltransferase
VLVYRQHASTRSQAQRLIADGVLWQQGDAWKRVLKNGDEVPEDAPIQLLNTAEARYVSRGGLKLEAALAHVQLDVSGMACLDVGQSTGGFTDCLLQHGAASVVGVDVGSAQLHPQLRTDPRVLCVEKVNARALTADDLLQAYDESIGEQGVFDSDGETDDTDEAVYNFAPPFDLIVADLSFISQTLVLPAVVALLKPGGSLLTLVKPQFELQPGQVGKGGIVKDASLYLFVEQRLREACAALGLEVTAWFDSPIAGGDGNREFFICARYPGLELTSK